MRVISFSRRYGHARSSNRTFLFILIFFVVFIGTAEATYITGPPSPPSVDHSSRGYSAFGDSGGSQFFTGDLPPNYEYFRQINNPPSCVSGFSVGTGDNGIDGGVSVVFQKYSSGNLQNYQDAIMNNWQSSGAEWYSLSPGGTPSGWPGDYWYNVPQDTGMQGDTQTGTPQNYLYGFYDPSTGGTGYYDPATDTWFSSQSGGYPADWSSSGAGWYSVQVGSPTGAPPDTWYNVPQDTGMQGDTQTGTPQDYLYGLYDPATGDMSYYNPATGNWFNAQSGGYPADWSSPGATWYSMPAGSQTGSLLDTWYMDTQTGDMPYYWSSPGAEWYSMPAGSPTGSPLDTWYMDTQTGDMPYYWSSSGEEWYSVQVGSPTGSPLDAWYNVPEGAVIPPMGQTYYWRVDELPDSSGDTGTGTGDWAQSQAPGLVWGPAPNQNWYFVQYNNPSGSPIDSWYTGGPAYPDVQVGDFASEPDLSGYNSQAGTQTGSWQPSVVGYYNPATGQLLVPQSDVFNLDLTSSPAVTPQNPVPAQVTNNEPLSQAEIQQLREYVGLFMAFSRGAMNQMPEGSTEEREAQIEQEVQNIINTNDPQEVREKIQELNTIFSQSRSNTEGES